MIPFPYYSGALFEDESDDELRKQIFIAEPMEATRMLYQLHYMTRLRLAELAWRQLEKEAFKP